MQLPAGRYLPRPEAAARAPCSDASGGARGGSPVAAVRVERPSTAPDWQPNSADRHECSDEANARPGTSSHALSSASRVADGRTLDPGAEVVSHGTGMLRKGLLGCSAVAKLQLPAGSSGARRTPPRPPKHKAGQGRPVGSADIISQGAWAQGLEDLEYGELFKRHMTVRQHVAAHVCVQRTCVASVCLPKGPAAGFCWTA